MTDPATEAAERILKAESKTCRGDGAPWVWKGLKIEDAGTDDEYVWIPQGSHLGGCDAVALDNDSYDTWSHDAHYLQIAANDGPAVARALLEAKADALPHECDDCQRDLAESEARIVALEKALQESAERIAALYPAKDRLADSAPGSEQWNEGYMVGWGKAIFCAKHIARKASATAGLTMPMAEPTAKERSSALASEVGQALADNGCPKCRQGVPHTTHWDGTEEPR